MKRIFLEKTKRQNKRLNIKVIVIGVYVCMALLMVSVILAFWFSLTKQPDPPMPPIVVEDKLDYHVYATVLHECFNVKSEQLVLVHKNLVKMSGSSEKPSSIGQFIVNRRLDEAGETEGYIEKWKKIFEGYNLEIEESTLDDFLGKGAKPAILKDIDSINEIRTRILSRYDLETMGGGGPGYLWKIVRKRYPETFGLVEFSRIGFNRSGSQAILYGGCLRGPTSGHGMLILLDKKSGKWCISNTEGWWVS